MKGETVHAIFAEIKQQRANQYQGGLQRDDAKQPEQRFSRHCRQQRRDTAMTTEYEKHYRPPSGTSTTRHPAAAERHIRSGSQSRVFDCSRKPRGLAVACGTSADSATGSTRDSAERQILHSLQAITDAAPLLAGS
jgi:hypothetical protein